MIQRLPATALDLAVSTARHHASSMHLHAVLVVEGSIDIERFRKAVQLSIETDPVLGCRFVDNPIRPFWEPQPEMRRKEFLERYFCTIETMDLEAELYAFLPEPLDPSIDPLIQIRVFRQVGNLQEIVAIKISHLASDAGGLYTYTRSLIGTYAKLSTDPSFKPARNTRSRGLDQITKYISNKEKLKILRSTLAALKRRDAVTNKYKFPNSSAPPEQRMFLLKEIPMEQVQALKGYGRRNGATLNLVLLASYFRSICANIPLSGAGALPLMNTVDLRRYVPEAERSQIPLCNLSGVTTLYISQVNPSETPFIQTLALVKEQMKVRKADYLGLLVVPLVLTLYGALPYSISKGIARNDFAKTKKNQATAPVMTYLRINEEDFNFGDVKLLDIYCLASIMYSPVFAMNATEFRKTVTLCTGFCQTLIPRVTVEAILDGMTKELAELAEGYSKSAKNTKKVVEA
jgi:NRPS condensation-like uncharacterized protein